MNETRYFKSIQPFGVSTINIEVICAEWNENFELYDLDDKRYIRPENYPNALEISLSDALAIIKRLDLVAGFSEDDLDASFQEGSIIYHRKRQDIL